MKSNIQLRHIEYMPKELDSGILYVSKRFQVAAHLCPCGCGSKIVTPLGHAEWTFSEKKGRPTLYPSIGNWQIPCRSHYWITNGEIRWSYPWTDDQIEQGRKREQEQREAYYNSKSKHPKKSLFQQLIEWIFPKHK